MDKGSYIEDKGGKEGGSRRRRPLVASNDVSTAVVLQGAGKDLSAPPFSRKLAPGPRARPHLLMPSCGRRLRSKASLRQSSCRWERGWSPGLLPWSAPESGRGQEEVMGVESERRRNESKREERKEGGSQEGVEGLRRGKGEGSLCRATQATFLDDSPSTFLSR